MADLNTHIGAGPQAAGYTAPAPAAPPPPTPTAEVSATGPATARPTPAAAQTTAKQEHNEVTAGFNPSVTIDPDTHILVMTIRAPDGETLRQMPNKQELAAYKASATESKKAG